MFTVINTYLNQTAEVRHELQLASGRVVNVGAGDLQDMIEELQEAQAKGEALMMKLDAAAE